jgi:WD40 repeat protein
VTCDGFSFEKQKECPVHVTAIRICTAIHVFLHICRYLATGSFDKNIYVWSVADGSLIRTCKGEAGIYDVSWNEAGDKVAACFANRTVCVVDLRL